MNAGHERISSLKLANQVVVIVGASSGIGLATARTASRAGAEVTMVSRTQQKLAAAASDITPTLHVPVPVVNRSHAPMGMPEHSFDELVARIPEAFREACRDRSTQIVRAEFLHLRTDPEPTVIHLSHGLRTL